MVRELTDLYTLAGELGLVGLLGDDGFTGPKSPKTCAGDATCDGWDACWARLDLMESQDQHAHLESSDCSGTTESTVPLGRTLWLVSLNW